MCGIQPSPARASDISLDFQAETLPNFLQAIFKAVVKKDYVVHPDVLKDAAPVTLNINNKTPDQLLEFLRLYLDARGVSLTQDKGVFFVQPKAKEQGGASPVQNLMQPLAPVAVDYLASSPASKLQFYSYRPRSVAPDTLMPILQAAGILNPLATKDQVFFRVSAEDYPALFAMLEKADHRPQQYSIRVALIEYTESKSDSMSFQSVVDILGKRLGIRHVSGVVGDYVHLTTAGFDLVLSALQEDSRFHSLAQPLLTAADGAQALFSVGSDVPTRGSIQLDKNGNPVSSIEYKSSGLILEIQPTSSGRFVSLDVRQQLSSFAVTKTSSIDSPTRLIRQAKTVLNVKRGDLVLLAGLEDEKSSESLSGLSFLPDWLNSSASSVNKTQLLILLEVI